MHKTPHSSSTTDARTACYATGLTNANLFQTDFAAIERRQSLVALQRRLARWETLAHHFQESAAMARAIFSTMRQHGPLRGLRPTLLLIKQDLEARL